MGSPEGCHEVRGCVAKRRQFTIAWFGLDRCFLLSIGLAYQEFLFLHCFLFSCIICVRSSIHSAHVSGMHFVHFYVFASVPKPLSSHATRHACNNCFFLREGRPSNSTSVGSEPCSYCSASYSFWQARARVKLSSATIRRQLYDLVHPTGGNYGVPYTQ